MDFKQFSQPEFDPNAWLNSALSSFAEDANPLPLVKQLSSQLDSEILMVRGEVDTITKQIIHQLPNISRDIEVIHNEVAHLEEDMTTGLADAEKVQQKTTLSMSTLEKLDNVKTKLVATSSALQEADKWSTLAKEIEQFLDSGDVQKSYECILGMETVLSSLNRTNQTEERRLILEEMKNRLEALATKHLILAFDTNNSGNAQYFFNMFSNIERAQQFIKYFQNSEKIKISQEWRKLVEIMTFKEASVKFYDSLIDHWHAKLQWCKIIFNDEDTVNSTNVLIDLYAETLRTLEPSLQFCFDSETKKVPFIDLLLHFNQTTHRFLQNIKQFVTSQGGKTDSLKVSSFLKSIFQPFLAQYSKYSKHHESVIKSKIQAASTSMISSDSSSTTERSIAISLQDRIENSKRLLPDLVLIIKENEEKVNLFNLGFGYLHFGKGLSSGLQHFINWNRDIYKLLQKSVDIPDTHNRNLLENSLAMAETFGDILLQLIKLDQVLSTNCGKIFGKMTSSLENSNPWEDEWGYYLDSAIRTEIIQFVQKKETLLGQVINQMKKLCCDATQLVFRVTSEPMEIQFKKKFSVLDSSLKSAIPSEYITQIGEYLMLLPQNLEPFIASENSAISFAFEQTSDEEGRSPVDFILSNLSVSICDAYTKRILQCNSLSDGQAKQLEQDIQYLSSVLEDLGFHISNELNSLSKLFKNYGNLNDTAVTERIPANLVSAVIKMKTKPHGALETKGY